MMPINTDEIFTSMVTFLNAAGPEALVEPINDLRQVATDLCKEVTRAKKRVKKQQDKQANAKKS